MLVCRRREHYLGGMGETDTREPTEEMTFRKLEEQFAQGSPEISETEQRLSAIQKRIDAIRKQSRFQAQTSAASSFHDVTTNLMSSARSCVRFLSDPFDDDPDDPDDSMDDAAVLTGCIEKLEKYLDLVESRDDILVSEMTNGSYASPEARAAADQGGWAIPKYVDMLAQHALDDQDRPPA